MTEEKDLFDRLGGTRKIAAQIGEPVSTVQSWKVAGRIPAQKQTLLIEKYAEIGRVITADEVVWPMRGLPESEAA